MKITPTRTNKLVFGIIGGLTGTIVVVLPTTLVLIKKYDQEKDVDTIVIVKDNLYYSHYTISEQENNTDMKSMQILSYREWKVWWIDYV